MPYKKLVVVGFFLSLFLFPETIPCGVCCKQLRLKDERLNPGWESRGYADVEIFKIHFGQLILFFFFCCVSTQQPPKWCFFLFFFFQAHIEMICLGQLLPRDEKAEINTMLL